MKYILGIGPIIKKKYKKFPSMRISIDNHFIDEFTVLDDNRGHDKILADKRWWRYSPPINPETYAYAEQGSFPKKFNLYMLDDDFLKDKKSINISVDNNDSNYTNGFMTKSTLLDLRFIFLIPVNYLNVFLNSGKNFYKDLSDVIPNIYKGQTDATNVFQFKQGHQTLGYPFSFNSQWNGSYTNNKLDNFGGSGLLSIELFVNKNNIISFHPYEDKIDSTDIWINNNLPYQNRTHLNWESNYPVTGFPVSILFFVMVHKGLFDKYIYENQ